MIVSLRGTVIDITAHHAVIECAGVGYQALASLGFAEKTAEPVLTTVLAADPTLTTPAALRASLNLLGKQ